MKPGTVVVASRAATVLGLAIAAAAACSTGSAPAGLPRPAPAAPSFAPTAIDVTVRVDEDFQVHERLCFAGAPPERVLPEDARARAHLVSAQDDDGGALPVDGFGVDTRGLEDDACLDLVIDLDGYARAHAGLDAAVRVGDDLLASPDAWLWRPDPWSDAVVAHLVLDAGGRQVQVPFAPAADGAWLVPRSTFRLRSYAAFGRFTVRERAVGPTQVSLSLLGTQAQNAAFEPWLVQALQATATVAPLSSSTLRVFVVATAGGPPVQAGFYGRGGGATAVFFVGSDGPPRDDPTATRWIVFHEMAHALLPPVQETDAWMNEGLATYHQELLARRVGAHVDDKALFTALVRTFNNAQQQAQASGKDLETASRTMFAADLRTEAEQDGTFQHVYGAGAAVAFLADVSVRQQTGGEVSLDRVVAFLRARYPDDRPRGALELLDTAIASGDADVALAARAWKAAWEDSRHRRFPDVEFALVRLGVLDEGAGASVFLDDDAPWAVLRPGFSATLRP